MQSLLLEEAFEDNIHQMIKLGERRVVNPLFSFFCNENELLKWRSVTAMGMVVDHLANHHAESARVVMRRFLWNLNDESGGIGWGSPEAMGEVMARNDLMAREYCRMLISYINPDGNFLEHGGLQRGVLWGFGRLAQIRPNLLKDGALYLNPFMESPDAYKRGLAAWAAGPLRRAANRPYMERLFNDDSEFEIYIDGAIRKCTVGECAKAQPGI